MATETVKQVEDGWDRIRSNAISKLEEYLDTGNASVIFSKKEYMENYTYIFASFHTH